jgi:tRNA nucleotidyltransferase (CCA-adding enzyme)
MSAMDITLPKGVGYIIKELNKNGHEAYVVGGCIRDILIGLQPKDYDITTSADPDEVIRIFKKTIPTGIKHGTVGVVTTDGIYDVTTYRSEGEYINSRYPANVIFIDDLVEDLRRRDITINAIAYNTEKGIIDPFDGTADIRGKIIRAVGNPILRFKEDALRILRAIRLATTLNFNIEEKTLFGIVETMDGLQFISVERIREELNAILLSAKPSRGISMLFQLGVMKYVMPEIMTMAVFSQFNQHHDKDVLGHTLDVVDHVPAKLHLRLAALFHDCGKPGTFTVDRNGIGHFYGHEARSSEIAEIVLERLKYDKKTTKKVLTLISNHMVSTDMKNELKLKKLIQKLGKENINDLFELKTADFISKPESGNTKLFEISALRDRMIAIIDRKDPLNIRDLCVNGQDIMNLGIKEGREVGSILNDLLEKVLKDPRLNEKETLLTIARKELEE